MAGIYIHIPFCRQICHYCDFHHSASLTMKQQVLAAIGDELSRRRGEIEQGRIGTLYFGGGTPSVCTPSEIGAFVDQVRDQWGVESFDEVTMEVNPDDLTVEYLEGIRRAGIDRLSIGIQSFNDDHLQRMNRRHSAVAAIEAVRQAQAVGFDNITIDLIYGLPWMTPQQWQHNIDQALALGVQHISAYHLTIESRTVFGKRELQPVEDQVSTLHFEMLREALCGEAGFEHYEVSNFALAGFRARHNTLYWQSEPYIGVGPSAHSYDGAECRSWNVSSNKRYLAGEPREEEQLTTADRLNEYLMTRLRTSDGISRNYLTSNFTDEQANRIVTRCEAFVASGDMSTTDEGFAIRAERFLVSDLIISKLFE